MREGVDRPAGDEVRWTAPEEPDDPKRADTMGRSLGGGLYLCGLCGKPVKTHSTRYRCPGHIMRSREQTDHFLLNVVRARLGMADLRDLLASQDEPRIRTITNEADQHRDYDVEITVGRELQRIREDEEAAINVLEAEKIRQTAGSNASLALSMKNIVSAFDNLDLGALRAVIDVLCEVRLYPHPQGVTTFNPETVQINWH